MRKCVLESLQPQHLAAVESAADNYADAPVPQSDQVLPGNLSGKAKIDGDMRDRVRVIDRFLGGKNDRRAPAAVFKNLFGADPGVQNENAIGQRPRYLTEVSQADLGLFVGIADHQEVLPLPGDAFGRTDELGIKGVVDVR